jgi:hypothetical protein
MADRSAIVGNYEQLKPGQKVRQTLNLNADGTAQFTEVWNKQYKGTKTHTQEEVFAVFGARPVFHHHLSLS